MRQLGAVVASECRAGDLVLLIGPLGAGKTTFTQGLAAGLGVAGPVTSPTFVIAREHDAAVAVLASCMSMPIDSAVSTSSTTSTSTQRSTTL